MWQLLGRGVCEVGWKDRIENCLRGHCRGGGGFRPGTHFVIVSLLDMTIDQGIGGIHSTNVLKKMSFSPETS